MLPVLTGPGGYASSGTTVSDTFRDGSGVATAPPAGLTLVAATVSNNGSPVRGSLSGSGWAVLEDPSGIPAEWVEAAVARIVTLWVKQAGAAEPSTVTYTGSGGGHHGLKLFALPATNRVGADRVLRASTGQGAVYGLDLGSTSSTSADAFAIAALIANGRLTGTAISDGFGLVADEARAAVATKELGKVTVAPDWSITTTGRGMSSALAVLYAAQPPAVSLGPDQEVQTGQAVTLTASVTNAGTGPGAGPHTFEFEQTAGTAVTLSGAGESRTFTPSTDGTTTFRSRAVGAGGLAGPWDTVNVVATLSNPVPVVTVTADDTTVGVGDPVTLTATATDPNGTVVSGTWTVQSQPAGAAVTFTDAAVPSTGTSTLNVAGGYVFRFTATDDAGATGYGEVTVVAAVPVGVNTPFRLVLTLPPEATTVRLRRTILGVAAGEVHLHDATGFAPGEIDVVAETPVVLPPTTATVTPSAPAITAGGTVTLTVAADGSTPRAYQWLSDVTGVFEDIPGATGISFTSPALSATETGRRYQCRVTNAAGSILSNVVTVTVTPVSTGAGIQAAQADLFVDSIGVNTHWHYTDRVYHTRYAEVRDLLVASGIRFYRDYSMPTKQATYVELAGLGLRMTAVQSIESETPGTWEPAPAVTLDQTLDVAKAVADAGGLIGVEAVNEPDISSSLDKPTWDAAARQHLADIKAGRDARGMSSVPVVGPGITWRDNTAALGDITQWTTIGNQHPYAGGETPEKGRAAADRDAALANNVPGGEVWLTEVGYHNDVPSSDTHLGTPEDVAGVYFPRMWLHHWALGIRRSFSYEFIDQGVDGQEFLFGMVRNDLTPKPAYTATKNLIELCEDPGPSFTPGQLDYTLTGANSDTQTVLLQKRDGTFLLFVWQATSMWDPTNRVQSNPADVAVTVNLGASFASVRTYRPNDGTTALSTAADVSSVVVTSQEKVTLISVSTVPAPLWSSTFSGTDPKADLRMEVEDAAANLTFPTGVVHAVGTKVYRAAMVSGTRNGHKFRSRFHPVAGVAANLGITPQDDATLEYEIYVPAEAPIFAAEPTGQDFKLPGIAGLPDTQTDGWYTSSGGVWTTDSWTARVQCRSPRASWYGEAMPSAFLQSYLYVHQAGGYLFTDQTRPNAEGTTDYGIVNTFRNQSTLAPLALQTGSNTIKVRCKRNTAGQNDGVVQMWLNGVLGINLTDVRFVVGDNVPVNQLVSEIFYNGNLPGGTTNDLTGDTATFTAGLANWNATTNAANFTLAQSADDGGTMRWLVTTASSIGAGHAFNSGADRVAVTPGQTVEGSIQAKQVVGTGKGCRMRIEFYDAGNVSLGMDDTMANVTLTTTFQTVGRSITVPANAAWARLQPYVQGAAVNDDIRFDNASLGAAGAGGVHHNIDMTYMSLRS